jgi:hypothetical protein
VSSSHRKHTGARIALTLDRSIPNQRPSERITEARKMVSLQPGLKGFAGLIGFFFGAVFLGTLVRTGIASAQCGPPLVLLC